MGMPKYKVYYELEMHGDAFVRASNLEEAKDMAKRLDARDLVERAVSEGEAYTDVVYKEIGGEVVERQCTMNKILSRSDVKCLELTQKRI